MQETTCFPYDRKFIPTWETVQFKVAAVNSNGAEGAHSNVVSVTFTGGSTQPQPNLSLNGTWEFTSGYSSNPSVGYIPGNQKEQVTVSGNSGYLTRSDNSPLSQDAAKKGYLNVGDLFWRNIRSTGNLTWSGEHFLILTRSGAANVVGVVGWASCTITMSSDGKTITKAGSWSYENSSGTVSNTWTRK